MGGFTLGEMIINGWPVLSVLLIASIVSVTVICDRWQTVKKARIPARNFVAQVIRIIEERGPSAALEYCDQVRKPVAAVISEILLQPGGREMREKALRHALQNQIRLLRQWVPVLGTVGSTAPFIGLLGTVIGIIRAFQDIAKNVGGGPEVVSSGIAEALITTAFGLLVAIPAVIFFNFYVHQIEQLAEEIDLAAYELIERITDGRS